MKPQIKQRVAIMTSPAQQLSNFDVGLALRGAGASGGKDGDQTLELSPCFKYEKLLLDLNFRDPEPVATQGDHEMVGSEPL